jgi:hypothetical protein
VRLALSGVEIAVALGKQCNVAHAGELQDAPDDTRTDAGFPPGFGDEAGGGAYRTPFGVDYISTTIDQTE